VENKPGAGGIIGAAAAAKSAPDGYTLVTVHQGTLAFNPFLYANPGYDPIKDFAPVTRLSVASFVLAVHPDVKAGSVADLVRLAKTQPGKLSFGSAPIGTPPHIAEQLFRRMAGIDVTLVPYQGGNLALTDLAAGRVTYTLDGIGITLPLARAGKVRMLAVTGAKRLPFLPDVPTVAESGVPGYTYEFWTGLCAPAGTPKAIVARLNSDLVRILKSPESLEWFGSQGEIPIGDTPEAFAAVIESDYRKWGPIIRTAGIKIE
jgi:tripartite-type tricarboxylate transporter receptor subunit TctC